MNILFVTLDQFRADSYGAAGHPLVKTPALDRIAAEGVCLSKHYSQSAPCAPGRAALYTGTYQSNNRVVYNGTPLAAGMENVATVARQAGYLPTLFGYTDQGVDPRTVSDPADPRLDTYSGILEGFEIGFHLPDDQSPWVEYLATQGFELGSDAWAILGDEASLPVEHSLSSFLTGKFLDWHRQQADGWFAHLSYLRPHPPYSAAGEFAHRYDPADVDLPIAPVPMEERHLLHQLTSEMEASKAPSDEASLRHMRAQYYGMISEVDTQLGRVIEHLEQSGQWDDTIVIVTSDHGEQLGDHGLREKLGFFPESYAICGIWRDPRSPERAGRTISEFTENVDLLPTLADALGLEAPAQCDGRILTPLLDGDVVPWRTAAHYEWDYRALLLRGQKNFWPRDRSLAQYSLAVTVTDEWAYVHFGDGSALLFDLVADPTWRTTSTDPALLYAGASTQLQWRQEHLRRELTEMLLEPDRPGRWPLFASPMS